LRRSFPRKRESGFLDEGLGPRFRGDERKLESSFTLHFVRFVVLAA
jgi:hypothetical protein